MVLVDKILNKSLFKLFPWVLTPNHLTTFRFLMIPVIFYFLIAGNFLWGTIVFIIAAFSDVADGALARTTNRVSDWGKLYDPLADKLLISTAAALLIVHLLHPYLAIAIIAMEIITMAGAALKLKQGFDRTKIQAHPMAKLKMFLQCVGVIILLFYLILQLPWLLPVAAYVLYTSLFFSIVSLIVYRSI